MPSYEAEIPESQKKDSDIISVKAKSFADREIRYTLKAQNQGQGTFNIGPSTSSAASKNDVVRSAQISSAQISSLALLEL